MIPNDQARRPGTKTFIGNNQLVKEAVIARIARFITTGYAELVAANLTVAHDIYAIDEQVAEVVKAAVLFVVVVVPVAGCTVVFEDLIRLEIAKIARNKLRVNGQRDAE